jgi:spermidine synthase
LQQVADQNELLYYQEGLDGIVAVRRDGDNRLLVINGKTDASSGGDLPTQVMVAQLPLALNRDAKNALVIGLGSGITAGTLATSESLQHVTILEISEEVVEASVFFKEENHAVLDDSKVNLVTADARNFLMASADRYDLIISEPSNPWITGISNLFTDEFFKLAKSRLKPNGVMTQWFHTYSMSNSDLKTLLKTFDDNFRYVSVWSPLYEDMIIMGSDEPHAISLEHGRGREAANRLEELERARVHSDGDLVRLYLFGGELLSRYVRGSNINSDNHPVIEFSAPKNLYALTSRQNMSDIFEYLQGKQEPAPVTGMVQLFPDHLDAYFMDLKIANRRGITAGSLRPQWLVDQILPAESATGTYGMVGSERVLTWQEGLAGFHIRASWDPTAPTRNDLLDFLDKSNNAGGRQNGIMKLQDETDAIWSMSAVSENSQLQLDMVFNCPTQPTGFTHLETHVSLPDPGAEAWENVLSGLSNRFSCYP